MDSNQIQQEISIIKEMIEKTRRETADSGHLFIFCGIAAAIFVLVVSMLNLYKLWNYVLPAMVILTIINGIIGYLIISKAEKKEKIKTYPKTVLINNLAICSVAVLMITFLFPFLKVYPFSAIGVLASLVFGIAVFTSGVIYELSFLRWFSAVWFIGAIIFAITQSPYRFFIMIAMIILGWITPGIILNRQYKNRSIQNGS